MLARIGPFILFVMQIGCAKDSSKRQTLKSEESSHGAPSPTTQTPNDPANSIATTPPSAGTRLPSGHVLPDSIKDQMRFFFSEEEYLPQAEASSEEITKRVAGMNQFSFELFRAVDDDKNANVVLSPISIQTAFSLLYASTDAKSEESAVEMADTLNFDHDQDSFHAAMHGYLLGLKKAFEFDLKSGQNLNWLLVNQVFVDETFELQQPFLATLKRFYNSGAASLPLRSQSDASRNAINTFVSTNTHGVIRDLLPEGSIKGNTAAVLTNSVYMLADWATAFDEAESAPAAFKSTSGTHMNVAMMHQTTPHGYADLDAYHAISLNYLGNKTAMLLVMPKDENNWSTFETQFSAGEFAETLDALRTRPVRLKLPKFTAAWGSKSLKESLQKLGMEAVFRDDRNHFPKLLQRDGAPVDSAVWIDDIFHKAKVIVDESGTEAAAATAIIIAGLKNTSEDNLPPIEFTVDRPALYFIYEKATASILFMGRLAAPE